MQELELDYWERRYDELFPNGLTQQETDEANANMWRNAYPTEEMAQENEESRKSA